jgi:hypothetical protein
MGVSATPVAGRGLGGRSEAGRGGGTVGGRGGSGARGGGRRDARSAISIARSMKVFVVAP